jgi:hypothetical protein
MGWAANTLDEVVEPLELAQIVPVVLHHGDRGPVGLQGAEADAHHLGQHRAGVGAGVERRAITRDEILEEGGEHLVDDRLFGVEVVVETSGEDAGLVGDLAYRRGLEALAREELRGELDEMVTALGRGP